jgi:glycosyltransferase involved in cell wall biosynthesis
MRLGINARRLEGQPLGVARYIEYLLRHWATMLQPDDHATLYVREPLPPGRVPDGPFSARVVRPKLRGFMWENLRLPGAIRGEDVFFGPSYSLPLRYRGKTVVTIHSVNEVQEGTHPWWYPFTFTQIYRASALKADRVIVPSQSVKADIQEAYGVEAAKIAVVGQGADDDFRPVEDEDVLRATRLEQLGEDRPYVVFVGKLSQRRNIGTLIRAFGHVKREHGIPHALLLMGPNHLNLPLAETAREAGVSADVIQTDGKVSSHAELAAVYSAADLYVTASLYEGFSLTLAEALACGTPVVASNRGALSEIAGDAAVLVDDPVEEEVAAAIWKVLGDKELQAELRHRGPERARMFRLEETARQTLAVLREVGSETR